ncbi:MAG: hypothetical protein JWM87_688 [Candidatus Eremiobacteraeota bacterium]|nr:hypothetical protein [Candidatus Eremiobacteraeota bacterium]
MKTKITLAAPHPVSGRQQTEITLHGGFEFLRASSMLGSLFADAPDMDGANCIVVSLRAPGGEDLTLFVPLEDAVRQASDALRVSHAISQLVACAQRDPRTSRSVDADGDLRPLERAS